jgi:hypothetical protein
VPKDDLSVINLTKHLLSVVMDVMTIFLKVMQINKFIITSIKCSLISGDTYLHSWEVIAEILKSDASNDMILDVGM